MSLAEIEKLKYDNATLTKAMGSLLDYAWCMKIVTRYTTDTEPNLLVYTNLISRMRSEYCENREEVKKEKEVSLYADQN